MFSNNLAPDKKNASSLTRAGKELDRNQLSIDFMNITPIAEEVEGNFMSQLPHEGVRKLSEFKIDDFKSSPIHENESNDDKEGTG